MAVARARSASAAHATAPARKARKASPAAAVPAARLEAALRAASTGASALGAAALLAFSLDAAPALAKKPSMADMMGGMDNMDMAMPLPGEPKTAHDGAEWQIFAFSTAAPAFLGADATVIGTDGSVLREGGNGWTCLAANPRPVPEGGWPSAHAAMPICADSEGMRWIQAFVAGEDPKKTMTRDTFAWMLHGDMGEDNNKPLVLNKSDSKDPSQWIESGPHLMLLPKDSATIQKFSTDFTKGEAYLMFPKSPYSHLMIPSGSNYYAYQPSAAPTK